MGELNFKLLNLKKSDNLNPEQLKTIYAGYDPSVCMDLAGYCYPFQNLLPDGYYGNMDAIRKYVEGQGKVKEYKKINSGQLKLFQYFEACSGVVY